MSARAHLKRVVAQIRTLKLAHFMAALLLGEKLIYVVSNNISETFGEDSVANRQ